MTKAYSPHAEDVELPETTRHELLSDGRRRRALGVLADCDLPVNLETLAAAVVTADDDVRDANVEEADRAAVRLHHVDLPKLDGAGLVDYDTHETEVTRVSDDVARLVE